jgi:glutamate-ammonia-ligase adenylyltransferase
MSFSRGDSPLSAAPLTVVSLRQSLIEGTTAALIGLEGQCLDKERIAHYLLEFGRRYPGRIDEWAGRRDPKLQHLIATFSYSRFLSEELLQHPEWLDELPGQPSSVGALELATFRRSEIFRIFLRDVLGLATLAETTAELSHVADAILRSALCATLELLRERYGRPSDAAAAGTDSRFSVIALGKLGGEELNYSSDIDLMFLYGQHGETSGPEVITNREFYKKLANRYTELLSTYTAEGLCYRVDLRLRPEGKLGEVCISLDGARQYYANRARDWELQMLIKARVAAGDPEIGADLLQQVEPLIYSTTTDFSTIETMSVTRGRIAEKLASKRLNHELDVKVTRGGIRDVEFLVQCLQRLHGGRDATLRHGGTIRALSRLLEQDLISGTEYARLAGAYDFLRHVEHRLQFDEDRQIHTLPADPVEMDRLATRMPPAYGFCSESHPGVSLLRRLNHHLEEVQSIYSRIVHAQRPLSYGPVEAAFQQSVDSAASVEAEASGDPLKSFQNAALERFWSVVKETPEWPAAFDKQPLISEYALQILNTSPYLSEQLIRDVSLLAEIRDVAENPNRRVAFESLAFPLNDVSGLRRFFRREMFRIQTASICNWEPVFQTLDRTSALAEFMIARAYRIALERSLAHARKESAQENSFREPDNEMMVVALGRLGMREFDIGSDADLLFIIPDGEARRHKFWTRVAEHVIDILTTYTGEPPVLSIDTRLRPNGREGLLVQSESTYTDYFAHHSEAWEGISYMKARAVAGDLERATAFLPGLQQVDWRRWGQSGRSRQDLKQMRLRLEREQGRASPLKAGRGGYYDADFALMYLRLKGAGLFFKTLNTPERIDIVEKMGHLERSDAEFLLRATTLYRAVDHGIRIRSGRADGRLPQTPAELNALAELVSRWTGVPAGASSLEQQLQQTRESMRQLFDRLFA